MPEGAGVFSYRGDDEHGRMSYDGDWKNKAAHGYGVMKWQNGDRSDQPSQVVCVNLQKWFPLMDSFLNAFLPSGTKATGLKV